METTKLSTKGQIILPKSLRNAHRWKPGVEFAVEDTGNAVILRPMKPFKPTHLKNIVGCTGYKGPARTIAEMDHAVAVLAKRHK